jgi:hypothetical protein
VQQDMKVFVEDSTTVGKNGRAEVAARSDRKYEVGSGEAKLEDV